MLQNGSARNYGLQKYYYKCYLAETGELLAEGYSDQCLRQMGGRVSCGLEWSSFVYNEEHKKLPAYRFERREIDWVFVISLRDTGTIVAAGHPRDLWQPLGYSRPTSLNYSAYSMMKGKNPLYTAYALDPFTTEWASLEKQSILHQQGTYRILMQGTGHSKTAVGGPKCRISNKLRDNGIERRQNNKAQEKPILSVTTARKCSGCIYYDQVCLTCDYLDITGKRRPCPAGTGCTEKIKGRKVRVDGRS